MPAIPSSTRAPNSLVAGRPPCVADGHRHLGAQHGTPDRIRSGSVVLRLGQPGEGDVGVGHVVGVDVAVAVLVQREVDERQPAVPERWRRRAVDHGVASDASGAVHSRVPASMARPSSSVTRVGRPGSTWPIDGAGLDRRASRDGRRRRGGRRPRRSPGGGRGTCARPAGSRERSCAAARRRRSRRSAGGRGSTTRSVAGRPHSFSAIGPWNALEHRRTEAGPHELGVRVVVARGAAAARSTGRRRCAPPTRGGTVRRRSAGPQREADPPPGEVQPSVAPAHLQVGSEQLVEQGAHGRRRPTGAAGGCRGRRAGRRPRSWRPCRRCRSTPRAARPAAPAGGAERGRQPARPAADDDDVRRRSSRRRSATGR